MKCLTDVSLAILEGSVMICVHSSGAISRPGENSLRLSAAAVSISSNRLRQAEQFVSCCSVCNFSSDHLALLYWGSRQRHCGRKTVFAAASFSQRLRNSGGFESGGISIVLTSITAIPPRHVNRRSD